MKQCSDWAAQSMHQCHTGIVPAPFYKGKIEAEEGDFMADGSEIPGE